MPERQTGPRFIDYLLALWYKEIILSNLGTTSYSHPEYSISCSRTDPDSHVYGRGSSGFAAYKAMVDAISRASDTTPSNSHKQHHTAP